MFSFKRMSDLQPFTERVWLSKPYKTKSNSCDINICVKLDDGQFASFDALRYESDGLYYYRDTCIGKYGDQIFSEFIEKLTAKQERDEDVFEKVVTDYEETRSIKRTAKNLGISEERIRKILITKGLYTCEAYEKIKGLLDSGKSLDEISRELNMPVKQIHRYLPYES